MDIDTLLKKLKKEKIRKSKKMTIWILFIFWIFFTIFMLIFIYTLYSMVSLDYTNNKLEKEIRMNIYDRKENFEIKIDKDNLEVAKKTAYEILYY